MRIEGSPHSRLRKPEQGAKISLKSKKEFPISTFKTGKDQQEGKNRNEEAEMWDLCAPSSFIPFTL
jgi:hypothetical protein